jgi:hypothetical protein
MSVFRIFCVCVPALLAAFVFSSCASQRRPARVGEVGADPRIERADLAAERARDTYDFRAPKVAARIRSNPSGALVEWQNADGLWVSVGNTPTRGVIIEATGKPELFRVSAPGYLSMTQWVAATRGAEEVEVTFTLEPELPTDRMVFRDD